MSSHALYEVGSGLGFHRGGQRWGFTSHIPETLSFYGWCSKRRNTVNKENEIGKTVSIFSNFQQKIVQFLILDKIIFVTSFLKFDLIFKMPSERHGKQIKFVLNFFLHICGSIILFNQNNKFEYENLYSHMMLKLIL